MGFQLETLHLNRAEAYCNLCEGLASIGLYVSAAVSCECNQSVGTIQQYSTNVFTKNYVYIYTHTYIKTNWIKKTICVSFRSATVVTTVVYQQTVCTMLSYSTMKDFGHARVLTGRQ